MNTKVTIDIYEIDGTETKPADRSVLVLKNHWNESTNKVVLKLGEREITVWKDDLEKAIKSVTL